MKQLALSSISYNSYSMKALVFTSFISLTFAGKRLTPLFDDSHPCIAENLKDTHRYICDSEANVICLSGWREPDDFDLRELTNPCPIPICDFNGQTCAHGECIRPDVCACEVGWEGYLCNKCVCLPGCDHGSCEYPFECNCKQNDQGIPLFMGTYCNMPNCPFCNPNNGVCHEPFVCTCNDGWEGPDCEICVPMNGCVNGDCDGNTPGTCKCRDGWSGHLCDEPICAQDCDLNNGYCNEPYECVCHTGWENDHCTQCIPYWECPTNGTCIEPNQCICNEATLATDTEGFCNRVDINGPVYGSYNDCSNPCEENDVVNVGPGTKSRSVRWCPLEGCADTTETCYGTRSWTFVNGGGSDLSSCIYDSGSETSTPIIIASDAPIITSDFSTTTQDVPTTTAEIPTLTGFFTVPVTEKK